MAKNKKTGAIITALLTGAIAIGVYVATIMLNG
jgi:ABC-type lipoprotein release transport system permease subunit